MTRAREVSRYDLNAHLHVGEARPAGVKPAKVPSEGYVVVSHGTRRAKAHRPMYLVTYVLGGEMRLGGRYACSGASVNLRVIDDLGDYAACARCELVMDRITRGGLVVSVYAYFDTAGRPLYVGQSCDLSTRNGAHRQKSPWFTDAAELRVLSNHPTRREALIAEAEAIRTLRPLHNVRHNRGAVA